MNYLFKLRKILVRPFGLKDEPEKEFENTIRNHTSNGLMSVVAKSKKETVLKLSDKHLEAYASAYINQATAQLTLITVVHFHSFLGKAYFFFIKPFHKIVAKNMLKTAIKNFTLIA